MKRLLTALLVTVGLMAAAPSVASAGFFFPYTPPTPKPYSANDCGWWAYGSAEPQFYAFPEKTWVARVAQQDPQVQNHANTYLGAGWNWACSLYYTNNADGSRGTTIFMYKPTSASGGLYVYCQLSALAGSTHGNPNIYVECASPAGQYWG